MAAHCDDTTAITIAAITLQIRFQCRDVSPQRREALGWTPQPLVNTDDFSGRETTPLGLGSLPRGLRPTAAKYRK
jgi:hypothetical protein